ncbi:MAG: CBS domain-containing protein [Candidatus Thermoplasmatota archaeon]|nr:CBS domain-containing protein [Candidatus Thermoplasmatota archaeon]
MSRDLLRIRVEDVMSKVEWTVRPNDPISEALGKMKKHKVLELPVVEGDRLKGYIKMRSLAKRRKIPLNAVTRSFMVSPPRAKPKDRINQTVEKLITRDYGSMPVTVNSVLKGVISRRDIIKGMMRDPSMDSIPVESIMNFAPLTLDYSESVFNAISKMEMTGESSAAVLDEKGRFQGEVLSTTLATMKELPPVRQQKGSIGQKVTRNREVGSMASMPKTLQRRSSVKEAGSLMIESNSPVIYIVDGDEIAGSVSEVDIMELILREDRRTGPLIQIAGMEESRLMDASDLNDIIKRYIAKIDKVSSVNAVTVRIKQHHYTSDEDKYTVNVKVTMPEGIVVREGYDYDLGFSLESALSSVEKHVKKTKDKRVR